jgi:TPR repeat protein
LSKQEFDLAKDFYEKTIKAHFFEANYRLGRIAHKAGNLNDAERYYVLGLKRNHSDSIPKLAELERERGNIEATFYLGFMLMGNKEYIEGVNYLTIAAAQNHEKATLVLGLYYEYSQKNNEEARKYYSILAEKKNIEEFRHLGLVEMKLGEKENGVLHLKEAC